MIINDLKIFLEKYDLNTEVSIGTIDGETGEWYELKIESLLEEDYIGNGSIGIQVEENKEYIQAKSECIIDELRENIILAIDKFYR